MITTKTCIGYDLGLSQMMFPRWFLYAVEIPKGKIPVVLRQRSVRVGYDG